jgi:guanylate kinase
MDKRLIVLSGPSCVGKGPLREALRRHYPDIQLAEVVLCHSRRPRLKRATGAYEVHGVDYYFLPRGVFRQLDPDRFVVVNMRSDIEAMDMAQVRELLEGSDVVLCEAYYTFHEPLLSWATAQVDLDFDIQIVQLDPLSQEEIAAMAREQDATPEQVVYEVMKAKLQRRGEDPPHKIEERARYAYWEMQQVHSDAHRIANHAGEDDREAWRDPLSAEARRVLEEFVRVIRD